jgi:hypothetical protein
MITKKTGLRNQTKSIRLHGRPQENGLASLLFSEYIHKVILNYRDGVFRWQEFVKFVARNRWQAIM